jgi:hypothetical protein
MKKIILLLNVLLILYGSIQAQEITRGQLMDLHYKAQKAERANNMQEALDIYKTILSVDASLPIPYLNMANIYAMDESNEESIAIAIALYNKYLDLQPKSNDKNVDAIKTKIAYLQKLAGNEQPVNLQDMLYINQEQAQNVIATKARPGLKVNTKAELEEQVEKVTALYDHAQEAVSNDDPGAGAQYAEEVLKQTDASNPLAAQANMMLAEMHGKQGDMHKMQDDLNVLEENLAMYKQLQQHYNLTLKDALPFEDDICGIWVSDLAYNDAIPFIAVEIKRDNTSPQRYNATLLPYCTLAEQHNMYTGEPFNYEAKYNTETEDYFARSSVDSVHVDADLAYFFFGSQKFQGTSKEVDEFLIKPAIEGIAEGTKSAITQVATDLNRSYANAQLTTFGLEFVGAALQFGVASLSIKKNTEISLELNMQRLFAGCAEINLVYSTFVKTTAGYERESSSNLQMRLYKLYPEDGILFAANGNELFGYRTFNQDESMKMEEYEHLQALKSKSYFNKRAYKQLSDKISDFCFSKASEDERFKELAYDCRTRFEYASKGLSYKSFQNKDGVFEGWVDLSGKMNGVGKCTLNRGITYIGNWEKNKYSGEGKITFSDINTGEITQEYTGTFKNNKYHGRGLLYRGAIFYDGDFVNGAFEGVGTFMDATEAVCEGTWKKNKPLNIKIIYANGDRYEGQCTYNEKTAQIERHGKGTMVYTNGETVSGKWKGNELITKK